MGYFLELQHSFQLAVKPGIIESVYHQFVNKYRPALRITSTKEHKIQQRSHKFTLVKSCRNYDLLLQNQSLSIKVSTPLFLQILIIFLSTNACSKSISIPSKSWLYKLASKNQLSKTKLVLSLKLKGLHTKV